jgi:hypothetical protein
MATPGAKIGWISASRPKIGHKSEENEDAIAIAHLEWRFAVADGATEGWESGAWARRLAEAYIRAVPLPADFSDWLAATRAGWRPDAAPGPVAWYAAEKQQEGSFATLLGVELQPVAGETNAWRWKAVAVGDSCLIHIRDEEVAVAFPLATPGEFGDQPPLVPSSTHVRCPEPEWLAGRAVPGDWLLLATDAVAAQLLNPAAFPAALSTIAAALAAGDRHRLLDWLEQVQSRVNDDASLIAIRILPREERA